MRTFVSALAVAVSLAAAGPAFAQASTQPLPTPPAKGATLPDIKDIVFKEAERVIIEDFFGHKARKDSNAVDDDSDDDRGIKGNKGKKQKGLPPGLAKKKHLPPGLQKQLERKGTLPPGLAKRDLPEDLESRLPPAAGGTERVIAGTDVVLVEKATGVILDVLRDVVTGAGTSAK